MYVMGGVNGKNPTSRPVALQHKRDGKWRTIARTATSTGNRYEFAFSKTKAPKIVGRAELRVVAPRIKVRSTTYPVRVSRTRIVNVQPNLFSNVKMISTNHWDKQIHDVTADSAGNIYIGCTCGKWGGYMNTTRKSIHPQIIRIAPNGKRTVIAGSGKAGRPVPGPATASPLREITSITAANDGTVYASMNYPYPYVVRIRDGQLAIVAGNGRFGTPVEGPGRKSPLYPVDGLAVDNAGTLYIGTNAFVGEPNYILSVTQASEELAFQATVPCERQQPGSDGAVRRDTGATGNNFSLDSRDGSFIWGTRCRGGVLERVTQDGRPTVIAGRAGKYSSGGVETGPAKGSLLPETATNNFTVDTAGNIYFLTRAATVARITPSNYIDTRGSVVDGPEWLENPFWGALGAAPNGNIYFLGDEKILSASPIPARSSK